MLGHLPHPGLPSRGRDVCAREDAVMESKRRPLVAIVDDDPLVSRAIMRLINAAAIDTLQFDSGQEFIDLIESTPSFAPDCVVLDVQMPALSGFAVQRHLALRRSGIAVIFLSGGYRAGIRERALASGAWAFFHKPFDDREFLHALHAALDVAPQQEP